MKSEVGLIDGCGVHYGRIQQGTVHRAGESLCSQQLEIGQGGPSGPDGGWSTIYRLVNNVADSSALADSTTPSAPAAIATVVSMVPRAISDL